MRKTKKEKTAEAYQPLFNLLSQGYNITATISEMDSIIDICERVTYLLDKLNPPEPYFGWCDVKGCKQEGCCGGTCWRETGYWVCCYKHSQLHRVGGKQPEMKRQAILREKKRDKKTGCLK